MARRPLIAALAALGLAAGAALAAEPPAPGAPSTPAGQALMARQAHFRDQAAGFKAINDELKKDAPDKAVILANATKIKGTAAALPTWFPKGSGPETGLKTAAKADIWTDAEGFDKAATQLQTETVKLEQAAMGGDLDAIKAQDRAVGAACGACHSKYRAAS
ncbi:cytochrome c [Phenylobacterium sp.]|jgi:cytochrome c556|uniref:c-type cytochrome n=1 Tax=Phenylobacterium sp. TaxID=1871053 RepID=UPI002E301CF6|nr:cytochrome c [Phenylobacterium sp.]HEX3363952.1 cytochrome c [Phenylobacterium sp.]